MQKALQAGTIMPVICTWHSRCHMMPGARITKENRCKKSCYLTRIFRLRLRLPGSTTINLTEALLENAFEPMWILIMRNILDCKKFFDFQAFVWDMSIAIRHDSGIYIVCHCLQLCTSAWAASGTRHCAHMQKALQARVIMPVICTWQSRCNEIPTVCYRITGWNQKYIIWCSIQLDNAHLFGHNGYKIFCNYNSLTINGSPEISWDLVSHFDLHF